MVISELPLLLSVRDVSAVANLPLSTLKRMIYNPATDFPPSVSRTHRLRFRREDILVYFGLVEGDNPPASYRPAIEHKPRRKPDEAAVAAALTT